MQVKPGIGIGLIVIGIVGATAVGLSTTPTPTKSISGKSKTSLNSTYTNMARNRSGGNNGNTNGIRPMGRVGSRSNSMMGSNANRLSSAQVNVLVKHSEQGVKINHKANTITYTSSQVSIVPLAAPVALNIPGMQWEIDGLINPTVVVPKGAAVKINLINADKGYMHGFEVTTASPPFREMAMGQGSGTFSSSFIMPILPENASGQASRSTQFNATTSGTYHYICPVPGHAALGMAGKFIVS